MSRPPARFELFLDESGDFCETSTDPAQRASSRNRGFPSQLAGLLVPQGTLSAAGARSLLQAACDAAGCTYTQEFHSRDFPPNQVDAMVRNLLPKLAERRWQPVRLTNTERVAFGDRVANYTNLVAELTLRCFQRLRLEFGFPSIQIDLHCAGVWDPATDSVFQRQDYLPRLQEVIARACVRAGFAAEQRAFLLGCFVFRSGRREPEIHLCDLLSNTSNAGFGRLPPATRSVFQQALARYDFSLSLREDLDRIDQLASNHATAFASIAIAERIFAGNLDPALRTQLDQRLEGLVDDLASLGAPARDGHLQVIGTFLEQTISWERDLERGRSHCDWFLHRIGRPLRERLPEPLRHEVDWFLFLLHLRALSVANHQGNLGAARRNCEGLRALQQGLVQRWERVDLYLLAQIHMAVHLTDAREWTEAMAIAEGVATFQGRLAKFFRGAMPEALPAAVHSQRSGEALGTMMQAVMLAAHSGAADFDDARALHEWAIAQFETDDDRRRQYQYRCQIETLAGRFAEARSWLAKALDLPECEHRHLVAAVAAAPAGSTARAFLLLHWLRLGAMVNLVEPGGAEAVAFLAAFSGSGLAADPWCRGEKGDHPAPSILRSLGEIQLAAGALDEARATLGRLRKLVWPFRDECVLLGLPLLGLLANTFVRAVQQGPGQARSLLDSGDQATPGLARVVDSLHSLLQEFPRWREVLDAWRRTCATLRTSIGAEEPRQELQELARQIVF